MRGNIAVTFFFIIIELISTLNVLVSCQFYKNIDTNSLQVCRTSMFRLNKSTGNFIIKYKVWCIKLNAF